MRGLYKTCTTTQFGGPESRAERSASGDPCAATPSPAEAALVSLGTSLTRWGRGRPGVERTGGGTKDDFGSSGLVWRIQGIVIQAPPEDAIHSSGPSESHRPISGCQATGRIDPRTTVKLTPWLVPAESRKEDRDGESAEASPHSGLTLGFELANAGITI